MISFSMHNFWITNFSLTKIKLIRFWWHKVIVGFVVQPSTVGEKQEDQDEQSFKVDEKIINKIKNFF